MGAFIGRERELRELERMYGSEYTRTCAVYGRRRIGKTRLLREFCRGRRHVFLTAVGVTKEKTMEAFRAALSSSGVADADRVDSVIGLIDILRSMGTPDERTVVVIDEFPNLAAVYPEAPALFQILIDHDLDDRNLFLIICGSSISAMGSHLNDGDSPLFGRFINQMRIGPLSYREARLFHPGLSEEDMIRMYAIASGVPAYHQEMAGMSVDKAVETLFVRPNGLLRGEALNLLTMELKPWETYDAVLASIRGGRCDIAAISHASGVDRTTCRKAVDNLMLLGIIRRDIPYGMSRKQAYTISDGLVRFHYDVLTSGEASVQYDDSRNAFRALSGHIATFYGHRFEEVCREYVSSSYDCRRIGRWWGTVPETADGKPVLDVDGRVKTVDADVDIVAVVAEADHTDLLLGECKFTGKKTGMRELRMLISRGNAVRKGAENKRYIMFSRSGFTDDLLEFAEDDPDIRLELVDMAGLREWAESSPDAGHRWRRIAP